MKEFNGSADDNRLRIADFSTAGRAHTDLAKRAFTDSEWTAHMAVDLPGCGLTYREANVFSLLLAGFNLREIARRLRVNVRTIKRDARSMREKVKPLLTAS